MGPEAGEAGYGYIEDSERVFEGAEGMEIVGVGPHTKRAGVLYQFVFLFLVVGSNDRE